jgi:hypothetical protein
MSKLTLHTLAVATLSASVALAQGTMDAKPAPAADTKPAHDHGSAAKDAMGKTTAKLDATLVEPEKKAKEKSATVKVTATGVKIVDPATTNEKPAPGQGHIHYTVDDGPTVATTATKLSFHGLKTGKHTIKVVLAGNDHSPLVAEQTLEVDVP